PNSHTRLGEFPPASVRIVPLHHRSDTVRRLPNRTKADIADHTGKGVRSEYQHLRCWRQSLRKQLCCRVRTGIHLMCISGETSVPQPRHNILGCPRSIVGNEPHHVAPLPHPRNRCRRAIDHFGAAIQCPIEVEQQTVIRSCSIVRRSTVTHQLLPLQVPWLARPHRSRPPHPRELLAGTNATPPRNAPPPPDCRHKHRTTERSTAPPLLPAARVPATQLPQHPLGRDHAVLPPRQYAVPQRHLW